MAINVKELKDDALLDVKVNKSYYMMLKNSLMYIFKTMEESEKTEESLKKVIEGKYEEFSDAQRAFFTITLMIADIEKKAIEEKMFEEKEILERGDEGYVEPTEE